MANVQQNPDNAKTSVENQSLITIPIKAEVTYAECKQYASELSAMIKEEVLSEMIKCSIPSNSIFADLATAPLFADDPNPYKAIMNILKQFAGVAMGGYTATIQLISAEKEIERLMNINKMSYE